MAASFFEFDLVAHGLDRLDVRADERDPGLDEGLSEGGVLRKEAIAGVDGLGPGLLGRGDDLGGVEIGLGRRRRADPDRLVGHVHMESITVGVGIDGDRRDAEPPRRFHDAAGDFAPIGNEKLGEHGARARVSPELLEARSQGVNQAYSAAGGIRFRLLADLRPFFGPDAASAADLKARTSAEWGAPWGS